MRWDEQAHRELDRIEGVGEIRVLYEVEHLRVVRSRRPRRKGDPRGAQHDPDGAEHSAGRPHVRARVIFPELLEHQVRQRFDGADDEKAAED